MESCERGGRNIVRAIGYDYNLIFLKALLTEKKLHEDTEYYLYKWIPVVKYTSTAVISYS